MNSKIPNPNIEFQYVDTAAKLDGLTDLMRSVDEVALDTEADSFHHFQPKICLIQLSFNEQHFIVDPLAKMDLSPFLAELAQKRLIIHDAGYDLRLLYADFQFKPTRPVFDTMLAASLAGLKGVGLSSLLTLLFDKTVAKGNQKADWSIRPLADKLLNYAIEDTAFLFQIKQYLETELTRLGRTDWHIETSDWAVRAAYIEKEQADPNKQWRIKGAGKLDPKEMAFIRAIWFWRHAIAKRTNIAMFMIFRNEDIIRLATWAAKRHKPITAETKLPVRCKSNNKPALIEALQAAQQLPPHQWPGKVKSDRSKRLSDATRNVINELKTECEKIAEELDLPVQLIASRSALTRIVLNNATTLQQIQKKEILMNWQANLLIDTIRQVLESNGNNRD